MTACTWRRLALYTIEGVWTQGSPPHLKVNEGSIWVHRSAPWDIPDIQIVRQGKPAVWSRLPPAPEAAHSDAIRSIRPAGAQQERECLHRSETSHPTKHGNCTQYPGWLVVSDIIRARTRSNQLSAIYRPQHRALYAGPAIQRTTISIHMWPACAFDGGISTRRTRDIWSVATASVA